MRLRALVLLCALLLLLSQFSTMASDADESIIEKTYNTWVRATNAKDIEWWSTYLDPQAVFLPPGVQPLETEEAILNYYRQAFADPHFALDCQQPP
jgi:ketosteroid isomerase-like protein